MKRPSVLLLVLMLTSSANADLEMPKIFSDNMVLQSGIPVSVWGIATPNEKVTVEFKAQEKSATAGEDGRWMIRLDPLPASSEAGTLTVTANKERKEFTDVLVGEVWLCSGQSNMASTFTYLKITEEVEGVDYPQIRLTTGKGWKLCTTESAKRFSAVAYYFGLNLWKELQVPVGLVSISRGCSSIEAWMTPESFAANPLLVDANGCKLTDEMKRFQQFHANYEKLSGEEKERVFHEHCTGNYFFARSYLKDGGLSPEKYRKVLWHMTVVKPAFLYDSLIAPVVPFTVRGVTWYQGETNAKDKQYAQKQRILIESWRELWGQGDFPFYIVQIAPTRSTARPGIWLQQYKAVAETPNSGVASTVDIASPLGPGGHPANKRDVGKRLALLAFRNTYGRENLTFSGPTYKSAEIAGDKIVVSFDNTGTGLCVKGADAPDSFEIAGADGEFTKAKAALEGDRVVVSAPSVTRPKFVRYAWGGKVNPNLYNREGLPAFPFSTAERFFRHKTKAKERE